MTDPLATRADTLGLFEYIHSTYAMNIARERTLRNFKAWLLFRFWLGLALTAIAAFVIHGARLWLFDRSLARHPREIGGPATLKTERDSRLRGNDDDGVMS